MQNLSTRPSGSLLAAGAAALALILAAAPAVAADLSVAPMYRAVPAAPMITNWSGAYIGIQGGGAWGSAVVHSDVTGLDQTPRFDVKGGFIGYTSGYNIQNGSWVYGYEGDTSYLWKRGSTFEFPPNAAFQNEVRENWLTTFRGRVGYAYDNWLLYATGGAVWATVHNDQVGPPGLISEAHSHWGWTAGAGVEMRLTRELSAKVEYLYVGLQDKSYFNPAPNPVFSSGQRVSLDDHLVRVGVNYKLPWSILDNFFRRY
ncbi:MAG: outer membrane protein [Xanthobacteraceae bacterium]|jgi:outer membrane immunogenic protein